MMVVVVAVAIIQIFIGLRDGFYIFSRLLVLLIIDSLMCICYYYMVTQIVTEFYVSIRCMYFNI